jgi:hypothetical protein
VGSKENAVEVILYPHVFEQIPRVVKEMFFSQKKEGNSFVLWDQFFNDKIDPTHKKQYNMQKDNFLHKVHELLFFGVFVIHFPFSGF